MLARRRCIPSVLHNYLGTLSSRYSDHRGYWVFGLIVTSLDHATIDLLTDDPIGNDSIPWVGFVTLARARFAEQLHKNSVARFVARAGLAISRGAARMGVGSLEGALREGFDVTLTVEVVTDLAQSYRAQNSFFVAPHDPTVEYRSARWGAEATPHR